MDDRQRLIFRTEAIEHYLKGRETLLSPQSIRVHTLKYVWFLLMILLGSSAILLFTPVPVYIRGSAIIANRSIHGQVDTDLMVVAFLPAESQPSLRAGQRLLIHLSAETRIEQSIAAVEPEIVSPREARAKFALRQGKDQTVNQPVAVVLAQLSSLTVPAGQDRSAFVDNVVPVDVEIGARRAGSFIPGLEHVFQGVIDE